MGGAARKGGHGIAADVVRLLSENAAAGTPCVLATVVRCDPPTSAKPGDKAVITAAGRLYGWIGGSCSEPLVRREALRALAEGTPRLVKIVPAEAVQATRRKGELTMATTCPSGGALDIFIEPQLPKPLLLVFGESPAAATLAALAGLTGFRTRQVTQLELAGLPAAGADAYAVVATMGHFDEDALRTALSFPDLPVTLVASRRRTAAVLMNLRGEGLSEAALARVRAPAKLRGATQEEIALLVLTDLVVARHRAGRGPGVVEEAAAVFATDPICGMTVEVRPGAISADGTGGTQYFCCDGCRAGYLASVRA